MDNEELDVREAVVSGRAPLRPTLDIRPTLESTWKSEEKGVSEKLIDEKFEGAGVVCYTNTRSQRGAIRLAKLAAKDSNCSQQPDKVYFGVDSQKRPILV